MHPVLQSCLFLLEIVRSLIAGVRYDGFEDSGAEVSNSVPNRAAAQRLVAGLRLVEAYLRRVLIIMALGLEATLVDTPQVNLHLRRREKLAKPKPVVARPSSFIVFPKMPPLPDSVAWKLQSATMYQWTGHMTAHMTGYTTGHIMKRATRGPAKPVFVGMLKARLDHLAKIAQDPLPRAMRLAYYIARHKHGAMFAPDRHWRPSNALGRLRRLWTTQTSATFDAMAHDIQTRSRARPPPLSPRKKYGPSIARVGG